MLHSCTNTQLDGNAATSSNLENLGLSSISESALVATSISTVDSGAIADIGSRVGRELDRVVFGGTGEIANVTEAGPGSTIGDNRIEEVVRRCRLGKGSEEDSGELHSECGELSLA